MSGPTVTLEFAGDESKLAKAMDSVGSKSDEMASKVKSSSDRMKSDSGDAFDSMSEKAGDGEQRFIGFSDTITGTGDIISGFKEGSLTDMAMGFADVAGGLEAFLLPVMGKLVAFMQGPLLTALKVVGKSPLLIALSLVIAAFTTLMVVLPGFRDTMLGVLRAVGSFISKVFLSAVHGIVTGWHAVVDFFAGLPGKVGRALAGFGSIISGTFKGAVNVAIDMLNWGIDRINDLIYSANLINPFTDIPYVSHISRLHTGGVVTGGMPGEEVLRVLQVGETVTPAGQGGGSTATVTFAGDTDGAFATAFMKLVRTGVVQVSA